jgi:16S rRNA (guanine966-N2)-methyltransferase
MRIIAGKHRGRKLESPEGNRVRPTSDMVRGAVFNIMQNITDWENTNVLDVCCGTGAFGIEALSRGAKFAGFIDSHRESLKFTESNLKNLGETSNAAVFAATLEKLPRANMEYDLIFIDPPYNSGLCDVALAELARHGWVNINATLVLEMSERETPKLLHTLDVQKERLYGKTKVIFAKLKVS